MIAAIYTRKSQDQPGVADEAKSVSRQVEHACAYAARKGWMVDETRLLGRRHLGRRVPTPARIPAADELKPRSPFSVLVMMDEDRLGPQQMETAWALKQLITAGVRVFSYLQDRERTLDSPTEKLLLSVTSFADELEREKARQRPTMPCSGRRRPATSRADACSATLASPSSGLRMPTAPRHGSTSPGRSMRGRPTSCDGSSNSGSPVAGSPLSPRS
jgi:hypothetical protein